jgi:hypothetical protein
MSNIALIPVNDIEKMATVMAKSGLFGMKTPEQAFALMLLCQGEGIHPAIAVRDFHIIQGRPTLKADAMLARFQQAGGKVEWNVYTDQEVTGTFSHPAGGSLKLTWTFAQAKSIGLTSKDNWKNYPRAMLRARCISEGIRTVFPGCVVGTYTPDEVEDFAATPAASKPLQMVEVVEEQQVSKGFDLFIPGTQEPYKSYESLEDWNLGFNALKTRIAMSPKFDEQTKAAKIRDLEDANVNLLDSGEVSS